MCVSGFSSEKLDMVGRHYHFILFKYFKFYIEIAFFTTFSAIFQHI